MSKASEWIEQRREHLAAAKQTDTTRPRFIVCGDTELACIEDDGSLRVEFDRLGADRAAEFAAWIIDTFGEPATPAGEVGG